VFKEDEMSVADPLQEDLIRDINEQIRALVGRLGDDVSGRFVCECTDPECTEPVVMTLLEFDARRRSGTSQIDAHGGR
jgi:hypothetical protein